MKAVSDGKHLPYGTAIMDGYVELHKMSGNKRNSEIICIGYPGISGQRIILCDGRPDKPMRSQIHGTQNVSEAKYFSSSTCPCKSPVAARSIFVFTTQGPQCVIRSSAIPLLSVDTEAAD